MISEGAQLIPSVTRVFSKSKDMYVFLQAYERNSTTQQPLVAFVTFLRGQTKVFETSPIAMTDGLDPKTRAVPITVRPGASTRSCSRASTSTR